MDKKRILCFGDSNTWGYIPNTKYLRFSEDIRFTRILQSLLGNDYEVIEEGLNSRTLISKDPRPKKEFREGYTHIIPCLDTHDPIDIVVLMLGTNELKEMYNITPTEIGSLLEKHFVKVILARKSQFQDSYPKLIIISPPLVDESKTDLDKFYVGAEERSKHLAKVYSDIAERNNCSFIAGSSLLVGDDGVHLLEQSHKELAKLIFEKIQNIYNI